MYSWTATLAVPVTIAAFEPVWVAVLVALVLGGATFILNFKRGKVLRATIGVSA
jgi:UDP-GlcNAc:undecaprenyl-phosphate GlcNAc-1-phosphate transferase